MNLNAKKSTFIFRLHDKFSLTLYLIRKGMLNHDFFAKRNKIFIIFPL